MYTDYPTPPPVTPVPPVEPQTPPPVTPVPPVESQTPPPVTPVSPVEPQTPPPVTPVPPMAPPPVYYYPPVPYSTPSRTNGLARASMILGILSIFFLGVPFGVTAIILGICSRRGDERLSRMAVAGIVCGVIGVAFGLIGILVSIGEMGSSLPDVHEME